MGSRVALSGSMHRNDAEIAGSTPAPATEYKPPTKPHHMTLTTRMRRHLATTLLSIGILAVICASADTDSPVSDAHWFAHLAACASVAALCLYGHHRLTATHTTAQHNINQ